MSAAETWCLGGGPLADGAGVFHDPGGLLIRGGKILAAGPFAEISAGAEKTVHTGGRPVLPGFANFHHHLYSFFAPGISPVGPADTFRGILENLWWPLDAALDEESVYLSALAGLMESVRCGVTAVFDHHASMGCVRGSLAAVRRAFDEAGVRGVLCFETSGRRGGAGTRSHIEENLSFAASLPRPERGKTPFVRAALGLHANFTLSAAEMGMAAGALREFRTEKSGALSVHVHCGEARDDLDFCRAEGFAGPVDRLASFGLLDGDAVLVHCVHLADRDYDVLREVKPVVAVNPESNANNRVGFPDFRRLPGFVIGTDGMSGDMIASCRAAVLLCGERGLGPGRLGRAVFDEGRRVRERFFPGTGVFRPGAAADIAVPDYVPLSPVREDNIPGHLIFGAKNGRAWMTVCGGRVLWRDGVFTGLDEADILGRAGRAAKSLYRRYHG